MGEGKSQVGTERSGSWPLLYPGLIPFNLTLMNIYTKRQKSAVPFTVATNFSAGGISSPHDCILLRSGTKSSVTRYLLRRPSFIVFKPLLTLL
jgi:hypothetical protein